MPIFVAIIVFDLINISWFSLSIFLDIPYIYRSWFGAMRGIRLFPLSLVRLILSLILGLAIVPLFFLVSHKVLIIDLNYYFYIII